MNFQVCFASLSSVRFLCHEATTCKRTNRLFQANNPNNKQVTQTIGRLSATATAVVQTPCSLSRSYSK